MKRLLLIAISGVALAMPSALDAEAVEPGLIGSVRQLDRDEDGYIEPEELNERVRRYLQPIAEEEGLRLYRRNSIARVQDAIEDYYRDRRRRAARYIRPDSDGGIQGFRPDEDQPVIPEFGIPEVRYRYNGEDLEDADRIIRRYDRNDDGSIDRDEARRASWRYTDPFEFDFNQDNRLTRLELAQRYARRRTLENQRDRSELLADRLERFQASASESRSSTSASFGRRSDERQSSRSSRYLAYNVMDRYDRNRNGRLEENEWIAVGIAKGEADRNVDGIVTRDELDQWIYSAMDGLASDLSDVLPAWFFERDANGDGQISMDEFADAWSEDRLEEFTSLDADGDGILTTQEMLSSKAVVGGSYVNDKAEVLMPRSVVISEIVVEDDIVIGDLNVQLSITHTYDEYLDGFLIGPDGEQIELFTGVGRNDDHFDDTIFDDEANDQITKSRPPFRGSYRPEARDKNETSLSHYEGKSVQGVWQLMIRSTRSDRAGILHHWSLIVEPAGEDESGPSESESDREPEENNSAEERENTSP